MQHWKSGEHVALRGMIENRVWSVLSTIVVHDTEEETRLLLLPGAQCLYPEGYFRRKQGDYSRGTRWQEIRRQPWQHRQFEWAQNRFLIVLQPQQYYAVFYIWQHEAHHFTCYYVNFQLPYRRSHCGFDTLDLDLDIVVDPQYTWRWKDEDDYQAAIQEGGMHETWVHGVEQAKPEVLAKIQHQQYPFDGTWVAWRPDSSWMPPCLPKRWQDP